MAEHQPKALLADKGYDSNGIRDYLKKHLIDALIAAEDEHNGDGLNYERAIGIYRDLIRAARTGMSGGE